MLLPLPYFLFNVFKVKHSLIEGLTFVPSFIKC